MTSARINEFNKKCDITFQIHTHNNRNLRPTIVKEELDWVLYLHNSHFCLIRRNKKSLGIKEIEDNYEQEWKTCRDDNTVTQVSPLKLNVFSSMSDDGLFAWDCETYSESETRKAIPYACTLINLKKLRKMLDTINNLFPDLNPADNVPEEFYDKLMNIVEIFVAMSDLVSKYPKAERARPFLEEQEFVKLFNKQKFRPRTAILTVWFDYPKNMFFQPIPADKISYTNKEGKKETGTKIRFRNGFCSVVLTSVDIQEIVKAGGRINRILDGIVYEENFKTPPYRDYILILRDLRYKYKREVNMVGRICMKLLSYSLYGFTC
ncbi:hypothetical protein LOTGIDRAFT_157272 [Lottia gigantea]|uniref:Uncharacterized protein n=1 Tax=Lottia gigantea TaxID=225164 RepID=V4B8L1_LOTGI|nr:hypothetical protein LOTGIDRAFT_157272 [Lottia gigantea]ESP02122.1 hypothetical protein LOTGIDRAFT_157272 [Lottia gigantea]